MEFAVGPPSLWIITLKSGSTIEVWADAYSEETDHFVFQTFVEASPAEEQEVEVTDRIRDGVIITAARVPKPEVASISSGLWPRPGQDP